MFIEQFTKISWLLFSLNMGLLLVVTIASTVALKRKEQEKKSSAIGFDVVVFDRFEGVQVVYTGDNLSYAKRFGQWYQDNYDNVDAWQVEYNSEIIYKEKEGKIK